MKIKFKGEEYICCVEEIILPDECCMVVCTPMDYEDVKEINIMPVLITDGTDDVWREGDDGLEML